MKNTKKIVMGTMSAALVASALTPAITADAAAKTNTKLIKTVQKEHQDLMLWGSNTASKATYDLRKDQAVKTDIYTKWTKSADYKNFFKQWNKLSKADKATKEMVKAKAEYTAAKALLATTKDVFASYNAAKTLASEIAKDAAKAAELTAKIEKATTSVNKIAEKSKRVTYITAKNASVTSFIDGAKALNAAKTIEEATKALETAKLAIGGYSATFVNALTAQHKVLVEGELAIPAVKSVNAINATQVEVVFNKAVDAASLFTDGKSGAFKATVTLTTLDSNAAGTLTGKLSADGKTLTVTSTNPLSKRYDAVVNGVKTIDGKDITKYEEMITIAADKTAPTIVSTTKVSASTMKVVFSEPIKDLGTVSYKLADGTTVAAGGNGVTNDFTAGATEVTFTLGSDIAANKEVIATFVGTQDQAGNLLTPNPATVSLVKGTADGVAPTVSSITQSGATKFVVKFSEQLLANPTVSINGTAVDAAKVEKDANDATQYIVTAPTALDGATTVAVSNFADLSGEVGVATSKVVTFVKDTAASKVVSSAVVTDETTRKEYLELTFDKDVVLGATPTVDGVGSYVKDYVTTAITTSDLSATTVAYKAKDNKKVIRVELSAFLAATDKEAAVYSLDLTFANVTSEAGVNVEAAKATFTRGKDGVAANTGVVAVTAVAQGADNDKVAVTFDKAVDGATATNPANYKIDGAVVESVTLQPVTGGTQVAVLNLKANSNAFTGKRNITIENVKALGSTKVMEQYFTNAVSLKENVAPTVTKAELTSTGTVTLTFSEGVTNAAVDKNDFALYIGGLKVANKNVFSTAALTTAGTSVVISLEADDATATTVDATDISKGLTLKGLSTIDMVDAAGNKVVVPTTGLTIQ